MEIDLEFDELKLLEEARSQLLENEANQKLDDNILICECKCISVGMIRDKFKNKQFDLDLLKKELGLGTGCSSCIKDIKILRSRI